MPLLKKFDRIHLIPAVIQDIVIDLFQKDIRPHVKVQLIDRLRAIRDFIDTVIEESERG